MFMIESASNSDALKRSFVNSRESHMLSNEDKIYNTKADNAIIPAQSNTFFIFCLIANSLSISRTKKMGITVCNVCINI